MDQVTCYDVVKSDPSLQSIVLREIQDHPHQSRLKIQCAAHLYATGWLQRMAADLGGYISDRELVRRKTREACSELRSAGIISGGMLGWFVLQFVILPYLGRLIREWLFGDD